MTLISLRGVSQLTNVGKFIFFFAHDCRFLAACTVVTTVASNTNQPSATTNKRKKKDKKERQITVRQKNDGSVHRLPTWG